MRILAILCLLTLPVFAQETQVGVLGSFTVSPGTGTLSWGVTGDAAWRVHPRFAVTGRIGLASVGKSYRPESRGWLVAGTADVRGFLTERVFLLGGISLGRVTYPDHPVERAYTKNAWNWRAGAGWTNDRVSLHYAWTFPDPTTFDTINGVRVGNRARGHEVEGTVYVPLTQNLNMPVRVTYRRLSFEQPYTPQAGTLHANWFQISAGISRVWRR